MGRTVLYVLIGFLAFAPPAQARPADIDDLYFHTYVGNDPANKTDPTGMICNQDGTLCTSDVAPKSTTTNVQNTPVTDKAMHDNAGQVRVKSSAADEKIGFINRDKGRQ
ncbi:MAG TPA: hypothetical protein VHZ29_13430 [Rhizomicrobium sp.]|jgi:hypothetical protein|nr:hypothetical protein [Rhizomicrobium sp.]